MDERRFLISICSVGACAIGTCCALGIAIHLQNKRALQARVDAVVQRVNAAIASAEQQANTCHWDEAIRTLEAAVADVKESRLSPRTMAVQAQLEQAITDARNANRDYNRRLSEGWTIFEGRFMSPAEKSSILNERLRQAEEKRSREEAAKQKQLEEQARKDAAKQEQERREKEKERGEMERKAREMYGSYKTAADALADSLLRVMSATEAGISRTKYSDMMQDLQFKYNKFALARSDTEKTYDSFKRLVTAVEQFREAGRWWDLNLDVDRSPEYERRLEYRKKVQEALGKASDEYKAAMSALAKGQ